MKTIWILTDEFDYDGEGVEDIQGVATSLKEIEDVFIPEAIKAKSYMAPNWDCYFAIEYVIGNFDVVNFVRFNRYDANGNIIPQRCGITSLATNQSINSA